MLRVVKRRRLVLGLVFLSLAIGLGWLVVRETRVRTFTLPDGSLLYLRGVTVGSNVPMNFGSAFERLMGKGPGNIGRKFRRNEWIDESDREALVFWFEFEKPPRSNSMVDVEFRDPTQRRQFQAQSWLAAYTLPNGKVIASCAFPTWPRQDKTLAVEVSLADPERANGDEGERHPLGDANVRNPGASR